MRPLDNVMVMQPFALFALSSIFVNKLASVFIPVSNLVLNRGCPSTFLVSSARFFKRIMAIDKFGCHIGDGIVFAHKSLFTGADEILRSLQIFVCFVGQMNRKTFHSQTLSFRDFFFKIYFAKT